MTYNEEEVKELFEVVFKLSAKDINDKLIKVRNRPEIAKRRWFWELLQNAKDAVKPDERVSVKLIIGSNNGQEFIDFQHNGNPFRYQDAKNLVFPYSDKGDEENSDKSGRFGTGFLATHILSKKTQVKGIYLKDDQALNFNFTLDRSGSDKPQIAESINNTWQEFRAKRTEIQNYKYSSSNFETSFKYELDTHSLHLATQSILDFDVSLPFALAFIPKIQSVEILNQISNSTITYHKIDETTKQLTENIKLIAIEKKTFENGQNKAEIINLIICSDGVVDIAVEIYELNGKTYIKEFIEHQPLLFCPFPLIGANDFKFPLAINSISFLPKEERDGIWLADTIEGKTNQGLLEQVVPLFQSITNYASTQKWQDTYLLFKSLKDSLLIADFNSTWFKEKIQTPIKNYIKQVPLVDVDNGESLPISLNEQKVYFQSELKEDVRLQLWDFMNALFPNRIPQKVQSSNWYGVIWDDCPKHNINSFTKLISSYKTVENLQIALSKTKDETLLWLNNFVAFVNKEEASLLNITDSQILPNQFGTFKKKDELFLDDDTIDQELKIILADISKVTSKVTDWRNDMLDKKIFLELPSTRTKTLSLIGTTISDTIKDLLKEENPSNELRDVFSRLLNWLNDNHYKAKEHFKGLRTETLLYKTANESKIRHITDLLQKDRDGKISVEDLSNIDATKIALLQDPDLELKIRLGEQVLADLRKEKEEFKFKKETGDIFETLFHQLINNDNRLIIQKVEGEEDFIITNPANDKRFYIELKSIRTTENQINMTHKQAKKANAHPDNYFLCIIPNNGEHIDQNYFLNNAKFDQTIGLKLSNKIKEALAFEAPEVGISVEFEDALLSSYSKYRYKFAIQRNIWGQDNFDVFKTKLLN
ncbi:sacsin N-terminal ATP-binding-like domain-containing protein [Flavobacterium sp. 140616W15]|uniref:sacsin N-terminal ATP-binding-like domain-containing protein n=1 Tax=Flavobacterium sp. 140616W15 TaxID=2478552 RepID=UPI000F0CDF87|nr:DUF3883 domain-containing protein [Flavobacterium sp. 140616W15]AYN03587.1 DUF3883 domain-containing protein [Flavobacterium sp. 140616W15]